MVTKPGDRYRANPVGTRGMQIRELWEKAQPVGARGSGEAGVWGPLGGTGVLPPAGALHGVPGQC